MGVREVAAAYERVKREPTDMIEHMDVIKHYASQCESAVEFGVYDCTSTWALLAGLLTGPSKQLTSYDIARRVEVAEVEAAASDSGTVFRFVLASSLEVEIEPCDLLFIDSMHTYEHLKRELALHAGKAHKFIILHDTTTFGEIGQTNESPGLWLAVAEFLVEHSEWLILERRTNCHGLTVLKRTA